MTKANMIKLMFTMTSEMLGGCTDVQMVGGSKVSDEYRDKELLGYLHENIKVGDRYHIEYEEFSKFIGIWYTVLNEQGKATGYTLKYNVDTENKTQLQICADLAYWLMRIRIDNRWF